MKALIPISIKRLTAFKLKQVKKGELSREEAEQVLKKEVRHSSKLRADLVEGMTSHYDADTVKALKYFKLI